MSSQLERELQVPPDPDEAQPEPELTVEQKVDAALLLAGRAMRRLNALERQLHRSTGTPHDTVDVQ